MSRPLIRIPLELSDPNDTLPIANLEDAVLAIPGLMSWHIPSDATYVTKDGSNRVSALLDRTGNGRTFTQGTGTVQPLYETAQINSLPAVRFASSRGDRMTWGGSFPTVDHSIAMVMKFVGAATGIENVIGSTSPADGKHSLFRTTSTPLRYVVDDAAQVVQADAISMPDDTWKLVIASFKRSTGRVSLKISDAAAVTSTNSAAASAVTTLYLGGPSASSGQWTGQVADMLITSSDLLDSSNASHLSALQQYVESRYALTVI